MSNSLSSSDPRLKIALPIVIEWSSEEKSFFRVRTVTDNISLGGICFILSQKEYHPSLGMDQQIRIIVNQGRIATTATVKHITTSPEGSVRIGIELFEPVFEWLAR